MHRRESGISQDIRGCGWSLAANGGGGAAATVAQKGGGETRGGDLSYVYVYVSHLSAQILLWLYAVGARNFTYVRTFVPSRYNIRT